MLSQIDNVFHDYFLSENLFTLEGMIYLLFQRFNIIQIFIE